MADEELHLSAGYPAGEATPLATSFLTLLGEQPDGQVARPSGLELELLAMITVQIQCNCAQIYAFDVGPVG
jgi:hypothetical protein